MPSRQAPWGIVVLPPSDGGGAAPASSVPLSSPIGLSIEPLPLGVPLPAALPLPLGVLLPLGLVPVLSLPLLPVPEEPPPLLPPELPLEPFALPLLISPGLPVVGALDAQPTAPAARSNKRTLGTWRGADPSMREVIVFPFAAPSGQRGGNFFTHHGTRFFRLRIGAFVSF
jgi:hypothetical protein